MIHHFRGFKVRWLHCFGPEIRKNIMVVEVRGRGSFLAHGSWETEMEEGARDRICPKNLPTSFTQAPPPSFCYLPIMSSYYGSFSELIY